MKFYIFPGFTETPRRKCYQSLAKIAEEKGYEVVLVKVDWKKPFEIFPVEKDDVLFGFSLGAVIAYTIAKKYKCKKVLLASMSPVWYAPFNEAKDYAEVFKPVSKINYGEKFVVTKTPKIHAFFGEKELKYFFDLPQKLGAEIIPKTGHSLTPLYIQTIEKYI